MKSLSLRNLIHFVGDIHQPLHAAEGYSKLTPDGDQGGNLFNITYKNHPQANNLHFAWDHMFYQWDVELTSPLTPENENLPEKYAEF